MAFGAGLLAPKIFANGDVSSFLATGVGLIGAAGLAGATGLTGAETNCGLTSLVNKKGDSNLLRYMNRDSSPFFSTGLVSKILAKGDAAFFVSFLATGAASTGAALTGAKVHHTMDNISTRMHMIRRSLDTDIAYLSFLLAWLFRLVGTSLQKEILLKVGLMKFILW